jgi:Na+/H+ antiporter NhaD/arsenite permease-like protein
MKLMTCTKLYQIIPNWIKGHRILPHCIKLHQIRQNFTKFIINLIIPNCILILIFVILLIIVVKKGVVPENEHRSQRARADVSILNHIMWKKILYN